MKMQMLAVAVLAVLLIFTTTGCIDRGSPAFRRWVASGEERATEEARKAIAENPQLTELDRICTSSVPIRFSETIAVSLSREGDKLFYNYNAPGVSEKDKEALVATMQSNGWEFIEQENELWETEFHFTREGVHASISFGNFGRANVAMSCGYGQL